MEAKIIIPFEEYNKLLDFYKANQIIPENSMLVYSTKMENVFVLNPTESYETLISKIRELEMINSNLIKTNSELRKNSLKSPITFWDKIINLIPWH